MSRISTSFPEASCKRLSYSHRNDSLSDTNISDCTRYLLPAIEPPTASASSNPGNSDAGSISVALRRPFRRPADVGTTNKSTRTIPHDFKQYAAALQATVLDNERWSPPRPISCGDEQNSTPTKGLGAPIPRVDKPSIELPSLDSAIKLAICDSGVLQYTNDSEKPRLSTASTEWESVEDNTVDTICEDKPDADCESLSGSSCSGLRMEMGERQPVVHSRPSTFSSRWLQLRKGKAKMSKDTTSML